MLLVTIVIPTRNRCAFLQETLRSVHALEKQNYTVIVVNDGSTDATSAMLARDFPNIQVLDGKAQGVQHARNMGVAHARTPWIMLLDDDDLLSPQFMHCFEQACTLFPKMQVFIPDFYKFTADKVILPSKQAQAPAWLWQQGCQAEEAPEMFYYNRLPLQALLEYQFAFPSGMTITKKAYQDVGGFDLAMRGVKGEDFEFTWRLLRRASVVLYKSPLVAIRKHANNDSGDENLLILGALQVFEVLRAKTTDIEPELAQKLDQKIHEFRHFAVDSAFVLQDAAALRLSAQKLGWKALSWRQRWKYLIALLPRPIARAIMRILQSLRPAQ